MNRPALAIALFSLSLAACPGKHYVRDYPPPTADKLLADLAAQRAALTSYSAEAVMDYWVGDQRVKGTVLVMGKRGAFVRFNALLPSGGNVAADLACNGQTFTYVDYHENCQLSGMCDTSAIAQLLRVRLAPDDFLLLALGQTPILAHDAATVAWDEDRGGELLTLTSNSGAHQKILLRRDDAGWQVLDSTVWTAAGDIDWHLQQKDFTTLQMATGDVMRIPQKTRFSQPSTKADLIVEWKSRDVNVDLAPAKFQMTAPGLAICQ